MHFRKNLKLGEKKANFKMHHTEGSIQPSKRSATYILYIFVFVQHGMKMTNIPQCHLQMELIYKLVNLIQLCSGITRGTVLNGGLYAQRLH